MVTKYKTVMEIILPVGDSMVIFLPVDHVHLSSMTIPRKIWGELGSPSEITVTVEAGDLLNQEVADV